MKSEFRKTADRYEEVFGVPYGVALGDTRSAEEHIQAMEEAMRIGIPVDPDAGINNDLIERENIAI